MSSLSAVDVTRKYTKGLIDVHALRGVSLSIESGDYVAILGPSGCGKSTLLNQLGLLDRPTSGEILVDGTPSSDLDDAQLANLRRTRLGFVFQFFQLLPGLHAWENIAVPGVLGGARVADLRDRAQDLLDKVGLKARGDHLPSELSGGERQRVAIARSLFCDPSFVLADEPTGALDSETGTEILQLLEQSTVEQGKALVIVTHDSTLAARASARVKMRNGLLV